VPQPSTWKSNQTQGAPFVAFFATGGVRGSQTAPLTRLIVALCPATSNVITVMRIFTLLPFLVINDAPCWARLTDVISSSNCWNTYGFVVVGYVVMPEHVHLLVSEPERATPSLIMQVVKQEFAKKVMRSVRAQARPGQSQLWANALEGKHVWQARFYDFNIWSDKKRAENLRYMHRNPVQRGLVREPEEWRWSSFRYYAFGERGPVLVNEQRPAVLRIKGKTVLQTGIFKVS
jgi:REP element-mobilizing transposase RayT